MNDLSKVSLFPQEDYTSKNDLSKVSLFPQEDYTSKNDEVLFLLILSLTLIMSMLFFMTCDHDKGQSNKSTSDKISDKHFYSK